MKRKVEYEIRSERFEIVKGSLITENNETLESIKERIEADCGFDDLLIEQPSGKCLTDSTMLVVLRQGTSSHSIRNRKESGESSIVFEEESLIERGQVSQQFMYKEPEMPSKVIGPVKRCYKFFMCMSSSRIMVLNYEAIRFYPFHSTLFSTNYEVQIQISDLKEVSSYRKSNVYFIKLVTNFGERMDLRFDSKDLCKEWICYLNKALDYSDYLSEKMNYYRADSYDKLIQTLTEKEEKANIIKLDGSTKISKTTDQETTGKSCESNTIIKSSLKIIRLANFKVTHQIGRGAFSTVYKAEKDGKVYALKQMSKDKLLEDNQIKYAITELNILRKCNKCPFIVPLYYAFQTEDYLYLALKYLPFGTLKDLIERKEMITMQMAMNMICELILTIEFLHKNNTLYRDMKPENILLTQDGHIYLIDFGLSIELDEHEEFAQTFVGTPLYLAPEWVSGNAKINYKADIFGVGCMFYLMLHGHAPFEGEDLPSIIYNIKNSPIEFKKGLNDLVEDFLRQTLETNSEKRLNNMSSHPLFEKVDWEKIKRKEVQIMNLKNCAKLESCEGFGTGDEDYTEENYPNKKVNCWNFNGI